jgi:hypothetical protein
MKNLTNQAQSSSSVVSKRKLAAAEKGGNNLKIKRLEKKVET